MTISCHGRLRGRSKHHDQDGDREVRAKLCSKKLRLKTVNDPPTPVCGVAQGVSITLGNWQGKINFTVAPLDIFEIILGQEFFQRCYTMIDPYLQQIMDMEKEGSCIVPLVKVPKKEGHALLSAM